MFFSLHPIYIARGLIPWIVNPDVQYGMLKKTKKNHNMLCLLINSFNVLQLGNNFFPCVKPFKGGLVG